MRILGPISLALVALGIAQTALAAQILCRIDDYQGTPISNIEVILTNAAGQPIENIVTDRNGTFDVTNVKAGDYALKLHPATGGSIGGIFRLHVPSSGLKVILTVIPTDPELVFAPGQRGVAISAAA